MTGCALHLEDEAATERLGEDVAMALRAGDVVLLKGGLGAGKTTLARALIRAIAGDPQLEAPSPTYTLCQPYETSPPIRHYDLYRITDPAELHELPIEEEAESCITLIEWPDRVSLPPSLGGLEITLADDRGGGRVATLSVAGPKAAQLTERLRRSLSARHFLKRVWGDFVRRSMLKGDASARRYETVLLREQTRILMDAPAQPDGPPAYEGKPYSRVAHLAENIVPFIAIDEWLLANGFTAPAIYGRDVAQGFLLIEHLGEERIVDAHGAPIRERYLECAKLLAEIHRRQAPAVIEIVDENGACRRHEVPCYDRSALMVEASLFADWYVPHIRGEQLGGNARAEFNHIWAVLIGGLSDARQALALRDFHSPNIIWREGRPFPDNLGLIDFQDAVIGPCAYDLASLGQDARTIVPAALEEEIVSLYIACAAASGEFDETAFRRHYAIMCAHRLTKVLGIFVRLMLRDNKPSYIGLLPNLREYLLRACAHPVLFDYREWCARHADI